MAERTRLARRVLSSAMRNRRLRRAELSYGLFTGAELAVWISLLVFAYGHGGASASASIALVQLVPCALAAPTLGALIDRARPGRVLLVGYAAQAVTMTGVAVAIATGSPVGVIFALAPLTCLAITVTRPAQAALWPAIVRTPDELTASNIMAGWVERAGDLVVPALAGLALAASGPALAVALAAAMAVLAGILIIGVPGNFPPAVDQTLTAKVGANLRTAWSDPSTRLLLTLDVVYQAFVGALDLLFVILAVSILGLGQGGAGYLNAVFVAGGLAAGAITALLVGRPRLVGVMVAGIVGATASLALVAVRPSVAAAFLLLPLVGLCGSVFDVSGRTLLQRTAPSDALGGVFSLRESLMNVGLAVGIVVVGAGVSAVGSRAVLIAPAVLVLPLVAVLWRPLRAIDAAANVPQVEISLLRALRIFAGLPAPVIEGVARQLEPQVATAGTTVVREGAAGDRYYAIADGVLSVLRGGREVAKLARGDGFGEIALIRAIPRVASVVADCDCLLYALDKEPFVLLLTGHPAAALEADATVRRHIGG